MFANIAADDDMVILNRFETDIMGDEGDKGFVDIVYPYASLKLVRDVLRARVETSAGNAQARQRLDQVVKCKCRRSRSRR